MKNYLFLFLILMSGLVMAEEPIRTWTFKKAIVINPFNAQLDVSDDSNPDTVYFLREGKRYKAPLESLSEADQKYVIQARQIYKDGLNNDSKLNGQNKAVNSISSRKSAAQTSRRPGVDSFRKPVIVPKEKFNSSINGVVSPNNQYILLIGVGEYVDTHDVFHTLSCSVNDMKLLSDRFQKLGIPEKNIVTITDDAKTKDLLPTRENIRREIEKITSKVDEKVTSNVEEHVQLIIAFSGHGVLLDGESYLCPKDAEVVKDPVHNRYMIKTESLLPRSWVYEKLNKCKAKQKIFIVDACQSDPGQPDGSDFIKGWDDPIGENVQGFVVLSSCTKGQSSNEHIDIHNGVFIHFLAEGLSGKVKDEESRTTLRNLFKYAKDNTTRYVKNRLKKNQDPELKGDFDDYVIAVDRIIPFRRIINQEPDLLADTLKPGFRSVVMVDGVEIAFRWCPAGTFIMGSSTLDKERSEDEKQHQVTLTRGFWMMETEVTVGMFKAFVNDKGYKSQGEEPRGWNNMSSTMEQSTQYSWRNPGFSQDDNYPVTCISWYDAVEFCNWLSRRTGKAIQLPTEAQWEYACRAGTEGPFAEAYGKIDEMAWYVKEGETATYVKKDRKTHPVGRKKPNYWGLYDMHGNVCEWCYDWAKLYSNASVVDPTGPVVEPDGDSSWRICRGGCWNDSAGSIRSSCRGFDIPMARDCTVGFRCLVEGSGSMKPEQGDISKKGTHAGERAVVTIKDMEFVFRWVPDGKFPMGSPKGEEGKQEAADQIDGVEIGFFDQEERQHEVTLTKGFWMMETEVTQKQWEAIMGNNPSFHKHVDRPVERVSWKACQEFCKKCKELGLPVQLPTEAQWEYACRAGTTGPFAGNIDEMAWYSKNSSMKTHHVGTKKPNMWGLYDMHGNVEEWCQDWHGRYNTEFDDTDPVGPSMGTGRVVRGGNILDVGGNCRSASRKYCEPDADYYGSWLNNGFRCVVMVNDSDK